MAFIKEMETKNVGKDVLAFTLETYHDLIPSINSLMIPL
jgi:hypothetical protein